MRKSYYKSRPSRAAEAASASRKARHAGYRRSPANRVFGRSSTVEIKSFDYSPADTAMIAYSLPPAGTAANTMAAGLGCLNLVQQGQGFFDRIGCKIAVKSIHVKFSLEGSIAAMAGAGGVRSLLLYDRQSNGAYPAFGDILQVNQAGGTFFNSGLNMVNRSRFQVIRDRTDSIDPAKGLSVNVDWFCKGRWDCEYGAVAADPIEAVRTGAILLLVFWDGVGTGLGNLGLIDIESRIRYFD